MYCMQWKARHGLGTRLEVKPKETNLSSCSMKENCMKYSFVCVCVCVCRKKTHGMKANGTEEANV